jgi:hypothetical protein
MPVLSFLSFLCLFFGLPLCMRGGWAGGQAGGACIVETIIWAQETILFFPFCFCLQAKASVLPEQKPVMMMMMVMMVMVMMVMMVMIEERMRTTSTGNLFIDDS